MNGLSTMVDALCRVPRRRPVVPVTAGTSKTATLRTILRDGPATSAELSAASGISRALVSALLKNDIHAGRVLSRNGEYRLASDYDEQEASKVRSAIAILKARGYTVRKR